MTIMSIGFKIKRLREEKNLSQPELAMLLEISQSELSKIENGQIKKIDFLFVDKVCNYFEKDFSYFTKSGQQNEITNHINFSPEKIINEMKKIIDDNKTKEKLIRILKEENSELKKDIFLKNSASP